VDSHTAPNDSSPHTNHQAPDLATVDAWLLARILAGANDIDTATFVDAWYGMLANALMAARGKDRAEALDVALAAMTGGDAIRAAILAVDPTAPEPGRCEPRRTITLADLRYKISETEWLWPPWLALGYINLLVGIPGVGKTALALRLAASLLTNTPFPGGYECTYRDRPVIWADTESSQAILLERAIAWCLPLGRFLIPSPDPNNELADFRLDEPVAWAELVRLVDTHQPKLVVIDSLRGSHRGKENDSEMADILSKLASLARDYRLAVLLLHHLRKANQFEVMNDVTLDRVRGSSAITAMSRVVIAIDRPNPFQQDVQRMSVIKSNLAGFPTPLGFTIAPTGLRFGEAPTPAQKHSQVDDAVEFLEVALANTSRPAKELVEEAQQAGIAERTLQRAKVQLGVTAKKRDGVWHWEIPAVGEGQEDVA
jgi:hypothetical protein